MNIIEHYILNYNFSFFQGKGEKQNKNGPDHRRKNVHKTTQGNHNRRVGAQIKRRQGMIPS